MRPTDVMVKIKKERSLSTKIAEACGITRQAVSLWTTVPWNRVLVVEKITKIPRHVIRPDIYPPRKRAAA